MKDELVRLRRLNDRLAVSLTLALESLRMHCPNTSPERIDARKALDEWAEYHAEAIHSGIFGDQDDPPASDEKAR